MAFGMPWVILRGLVLLPEKNMSPSQSSLRSPCFAWDFGCSFMSKMLENLPVFGLWNLNLPAGATAQSYPVSSFLSCFYNGIGFHGVESLTQLMCWDCVEIMAVALTLFLGAWQTYLSCVFPRV